MIVFNSLQLILADRAYSKPARQKTNTNKRSDKSVSSFQPETKRSQWAR